MPTDALGIPVLNGGKQPALAFFQSKVTVQEGSVLLLRGNLEERERLLLSITITTTVTNKRRQ
jgi:hypothetical protein